LVLNEKEMRMTNLVLFRLTADGSTWIADLDAGTVEHTDAFDAPEGANESQSKGVDFAVATNARSDAASHVYYPNRGIDFAQAVEARSDAASHVYFPNRGVEFAQAVEARSDAASHVYFPNRGIDRAQPNAARSASSHAYFPGN
jgi:hypothetical protein